MHIHTFCNLAFRGLRERLSFLWERTFPGRKDSFIRGNVTSESEFVVMWEVLGVNALKMNCNKQIR